MFKNTFNLNGVDYQVVDGLVHTVSRSNLDPCYWGDNKVLDSFARDRKLTLYDRPKGQHAYGNQEGQRAKTAGCCATAEAHGKLGTNYPAQAKTAEHLISYTDWAAKRIKDVLIDLELKDELPLDLNELDPGVFQEVILEILK